MLVTMGGMAAGQTLLGLAPPTDPALFILVSVLVSLSLVPISLAVVRAPHFETPAPVKMAELYRGSPLGVVSMLGAGLASGSLFSMGAVAAAELGMSARETGVFMAVAVLGSVLLQWPIGWSSDRFDRRRVIVVVATLATAAGVVTALSAHSPLLRLPAVLLFGGLAVPLYSLAIAHTNDHLHPSQMVGASAGLVMINGIGAVLGPLSSAWAMDLLGPTGLFWWLALVHLLVVGFALYRMTRREAVPLAQQGHYATIPPRGSAVVASLAVEEVSEAGPPHRH